MPWPELNMIFRLFFVKCITALVVAGSGTCANAQPALSLATSFAIATTAENLWSFLPETT